MSSEEEAAKSLVPQQDPPVPEIVTEERTPRSHFDPTTCPWCGEGRILEETALGRWLCHVCAREWHAPN